MPACGNESIAATYNLSSFFLGYYLYAETSGILKGDQAQLVSRTFPATNGRCMTFWYHMYGSGMGDLNVYVNINSTKHKVWTMSGDQGDEWKMARVTLVSKGYQYQVNTTYKSFFKFFYTQLNPQLKVLSEIFARVQLSSTRRNCLYLGLTLFMTKFWSALKKVSFNQIKTSLVHETKRLPMTQTAWNVFFFGGGVGGEMDFLNQYLSWKSPQCRSAHTRSHFVFVFFTLSPREPRHCYWTI